MAAIRLDQARIGAAGAIVGPPEAQVTPEPGRYEIDTSCSAVTYRAVAGRYLDMTMEVRCVRT